MFCSLSFIAALIMGSQVGAEAKEAVGRKPAWSDSCETLKKNGFDITLGSWGNGGPMASSANSEMIDLVGTVEYLNRWSQPAQCAILSAKIKFDQPVVKGRPETSVEIGTLMNSNLFFGLRQGDKVRFQYGGGHALTLIDVRPAASH